MGINAGSYVYSANRPNCNSWEIWFRTAISLKFDSFQTVLNKIMEYSENVVINQKKTIEFLRFPVIFLL
jgi:hypothetical protein